jgi:hypothetical protein
MSVDRDGEWDLDHYLTDAVTLLDAGRSVSVSIRELLAHLGAERRGSRVVEELRAAPDRYGLETQPDFTVAWIDNTVAIRWLAPTLAETPDQGSVGGAAAAAPNAEAGPALTIGSLQSASAGIISVERTESIELARTRMLRHDVSQLAVMSGPRQLIGAVTWESIAIAALGDKTDLGAATISVTRCSSMRTSSL